MHVPCCSKAPVLQSWLNFMLSVVKAGKCLEFLVPADSVVADFDFVAVVVCFFKNHCISLEPRLSWRNSCHKQNIFYRYF